MVAVSSSMISDVSYDDDARVMSVTFKNGRTYRYENVPADEYDALVSASSVGQYFLSNVRDQYRTT